MGMDTLTRSFRLTHKNFGTLLSPKQTLVIGNTARTWILTGPENTGADDIKVRKYKSKGAMVHKERSRNTKAQREGASISYRSP